jgi:hypothetical protein
MFTTMVAANAITGGLSEPSKMPGYAYSLPARACKVGMQLAKVEGSICSSCYALKGRYRFTAVQNALKRRLKALKNPLWVEAMAYSINHHAKRDFIHFRWHDSGDLQNLEHLELINEVCHKTPGVKHWLPTREIAVVTKFFETGRTLAPNLIVRISAPMVGAAIKGLPSLPVSTVGKEGFGTQCEARHHGGRCDECRACWSTANINYPLH